MSRHRKERRAETLIALFLGLSVLGSVIFIVAFFDGGSTQWEGVGAGGALMSLAFASALWSKALMPKEQVVDEHESLASPAEEEAVADDIEMGAGEVVGRRKWLIRLGWVSLAALGLAALAPLRSLGLAPPGSNFPSGWKRGLRLVREDGTIVRAADLEVGSFMTVFPQGEVGSDKVVEMSTDAVVLIRVPPNALQPNAERADWAPQGLIAYSKICTHAGCPVGLYRAESHQLLCPCHQSTFDVTDGARVLFGPAARPLPQLPLQIGDGGIIESSGALSGPIGPDRWNPS